MYLEKVKEIPYITTLKETVEKKKLNMWLVGGFLRDLYLRRKSKFDFDFVANVNPYKVALEFSQKIGAHLVVLDEEEKTYRVVFKKDNEEIRYDFSSFKGKNLEEDIKNRDFTINTLAVSLNKLPQIEVIDLLGAKKDLRNRVLRLTQEKVILQDPLRILRAFSLSSKYNLKIEKNTLKILSKYRKYLINVSGERIYEELCKILYCRFSHKTIKLMDSLYIIDEIIPHISSMRGVYQGGYHHLDVWRHSLETLRCFEFLYHRYLRKFKKIKKYLDEELAYQRKRLHILKLACLLHDIGKPKAKKIKNNKTVFYTHEKIGYEMCEEIAVKLKLSAKEKETLKKLVFWHMRPGSLIQAGIPTKRAVFRYFRDTEPEGLSIIFLSIADWRATRGELVNRKSRQQQEKILFKIVKEKLEKKKEKPLPKIVDGYAIMEKFNLKPSPLVGEILKKIKEEQALGKIKTKKEAFLVAEKVLKRRRRNES